MKRRDFIAGAAILGATPKLTLANDAIFLDGLESPRKANILMILVDEMRFPKHFPEPNMSWQQFVQTTMPISGAFGGRPSASMRTTPLPPRARHHARVCRPGCMRNNTFSWSRWHRILRR